MMTDCERAMSTDRLAHGWRRWAGWWFLGLALALNVLQQALTLPSGYGIEDFLGFSALPSLGAAREAWRAAGVRSLGIAYLGIDLALFVPVYAVVFMQLACWLGATLQPADARLCRHPMFHFVAGATVALVVIDLVETTLGLFMLDGPGDIAAATTAWIGLVLCVGLLGGAARTGAVAPHDLRRLGRLALVVAVLAVAALLAVLYLLPEAVGCPGKLAPSTMCLAHRAKPPLVFAVGAASTIGVLLWLGGYRALPRERARRAHLRWAMGDLLLRSRYVLIALGVSAALLLGLDQCRDLLVGLVYDVNTAGVGITLVVLGVSLIALWTLSHSCWLWTRAVCRVPGPSFGMAKRRNCYVERAARLWARALGVVPLLIFAQLSAQTLRDLMAAGARHGAMWFIFAAGFGLVLGVSFIIVREHAGGGQARKNWESRLPPERYYDDPAVDGRVELRTWVGPRYKFWLVLQNAPVWLPLASLAAMAATRIPVGFDLANWPPLAFATMLFAISAWIGFFGWLSLLEQRQSVPWVLMLIALVGAFGLYGLTDNHVVATLGVRPPGDSTRAMWLASAALAAILGGLGLWSVTCAQQQNVWARIVAVTAAMALAGLVLGLSDRMSPRVMTETRAPLQPAQALTLDDALAGWVRALRERGRDVMNASGKVPVYFVATEGGGARAAYWTALALEELDRADTQRAFLDRTFAISAISGGSIGAAVFAACHQHHEANGQRVRKCIKRLGATDLVSPLLGAWLFEDVLARLLPVFWCATPGCGVLSRGVWFEQALEHELPELRDGLRDPNRRQLSRGRHLPYLFLNSTWVESGERAIASEVTIGPTDFPTARDTLGILERDISLATAAHNSARFPFVNAIGAVNGSAHRCSGDLDASPAAKPGRRISCGHVADGGYFDNSGAHTVIDLLRGFRRWLSDESTAMGPDRSSNETADLKKWARKNLQPQVIVIHNGAGEACAKPKEFHQPSAADVKCESREGEWLPEKPRPSGPLKLYSDALGPLVTAVNVTGLGSNRRRADSLLRSEIDALRRTLGVDANAVQATRLFDHVNDGILYPLGWYLSSAARCGMEKQIEKRRTTSLSSTSAAPLASPGTTENVCARCPKIPGCADVVAGRVGP